MTDVDGNVLKQDASSLFAANAEWVFDSAANQIKLRRSGQTTGFTNRVYYNSNTGQYLNYEDAAVDGFDNVANTFVTNPLRTEGVKFMVEANSKSIPLVTNSNGTTGKQAASAQIYLDETAAGQGSTFFVTGSNSSVTSSKNNAAPTYWLTGAGGFVGKLDANNTNYAMGGSNSVHVQNGAVTGYAVGTRSEVYANSPSAQNLVAAYSAYTTIGPNSGSVPFMTGLAGSLNFGASNAVTEAIGVDYTARNTTPAAQPTIGNLIGFRYSGYHTNTNAPNITNHYGLVISNLTTGTNRWAIYTDNGKVSFGDVLQLRNINDAANASSSSADKILVADAQGNVKTQTAPAVAASAEPWYAVGSTSGATSNSQNIYQSGNVLVGSGLSSSSGTLTLSPNQGTPVSSRLQYGTDDTGYKFAISKNNAGTVTDQLVIQDNGRVGIDTDSPLAKLDVNNGLIRTSNENAWSGLVNYAYSGDASHYGYLMSMRARGTKAAPEYPQSADILAGMIGRDALDGFNASQYGGAAIYYRAAEDFSAANKGTDITFNTTANGTNTVVEKMRLMNNGNLGVGVSAPSEKLEVAGNVKANKFIASTATFPDYVFQNYYTGTASNLNPSYKFASLKETEQFIKENGHLPGFRKAEEIVKEGSFDVSGTALKSLEKIEELYLHVIELEKRVKSLEAENAELKSKK